MKVEKRGKKYRVQPCINGKRRSITFDHKPTKYELAEVLKELYGSETATVASSFKDCARRMIDDKSNILSPSTVKNYKETLEKIDNEFKLLQLDLIKSQDIQKEINRLSGYLQPKTVKNYYGFITSVFAYYLPYKQFKVKLPIRVYKEPYCPSDEDVATLLEYTRTHESAHKYLFAILCGCHGMRLGEFTALTDDDIDVENRLITINKTKVQNENREYVIKHTAKTSKSNRTIKVSRETIEAYQNYGIYTYYPQNISTYMWKLQDKLGMEHFSYHKLRHYFASVALEELPMKAVQEFGGWSTSSTLNRIYAHNMRSLDEVASVIEKRTI